MITLPKRTKVNYRESNSRKWCTDRDKRSDDPMLVFLDNHGWRFNIISYLYSMKHYAGIGSRKTPKDLKPVMAEIAELLESKGYILRSGGADGADKYFEDGAGKLFEPEIYLPWEGFNGSKSKLFECSEEAMVMAKKYHPRWNQLSDAGRKFMARNCYQVLGLDLKTPVEFIVCWTPNGGASGGTGQALRIAKDYGIPVFNLQKDDALAKLKTHVNMVRLI